MRRAGAGGRRRVESVRTERSRYVSGFWSFQKEFDVKNRVVKMFILFFKSNF